MKKRIGTVHMGFSANFILAEAKKDPTVLPHCTVKQLEEKIRKGLKVVSTCPKAVEESPGVWKCPGHPPKKGGKK
jgi:hypothetical protein